METGRETLDRVRGELLVEAVRGGAEVNIRVTGTSMLGSIWPGDTLTVRPLREASVSDGQIVLYTREGRLFVHRAVGTLEYHGVTHLITRGDAHHDCDPPVAASEILGTVGAVSRCGRAIPLASTFAQKLLSLGIRRSDLMRRAALKIHSIRRRSWTDTAIQCRA